MNLFNIPTMKKIHLLNVPSAEFLSDEEMKSLTGGLYGDNNTSEKKCGTSCEGDCRFMHDGIPYYGTCKRNSSEVCHCYGVGAGPIS